MIAALKQRKPFAAALIAAIFGPIIGMLYLNRWKDAISVLFVMLIGFAVIFVLAYLGVSNVNPFHAIRVAALSVELIGIFICYRAARGTNREFIPKWYARWYSLGCLFILLVFLALAPGLFYARTFHTPSNSMSPNLNAGDYFDVVKSADANLMPERGDIIVFRNRAMHNVIFVKRTIGLPGDRIQIKDGILYLNDAPCAENPAPDYVMHDEKGKSALPQFIETLPEGRHYAILKENRANQMNDTPIYGVPEHHIFVLGDNRSNSHDSRHGDFGFIAEEDIIGKASYVLWSEGDKKLSHKSLQ